jgi:acetate---CoA ligase (ADP-forming)
MVELLMKLSRLAVELGEQIEELDINPLIVYENGAGAVAADALVILKQS